VYLHIHSHIIRMMNTKEKLSIYTKVSIDQQLSFSFFFRRTMVKGVLWTNYIDEGLSLMGTSLSALSNDWIIRVQSFDPFPNIYNRQRQTARVISLPIRWWVLDIDICLCVHTDVEEYPVYKDVTSSLYLLVRIVSFEETFIEFCVFNKRSEMTFIIETFNSMWAFLLVYLFDDLYIKLLNYL
jgi:hypothetical protein